MSADMPVVATITVTKHLDLDDELISVQTSGIDGNPIGVLEAIGMLTMAADSLLHPDDEDAR